jgi:WD40 repeat protein
MDRVQIWNVVTGMLVREYPAVKGRGINALSWNRLGTMIAVVSEDERLRIWDAASAHLLVDERLAGWPHAVAFSPDGRMLAYGEHRHVTVRAVVPNT